MEMIEPEYKNLIMGAGSNPNTSDAQACIALEPDDQYVMVFTKFQLSAEELRKIQETGCLYIGCMGPGMPPILPTVFHPVDDHGYKPLNEKQIREIVGHAD